MTSHMNKGVFNISLLPTSTIAGSDLIFVFMFLFENAIKFERAVGFAYQSPPPAYFNTAI